MIRDIKKVDLKRTNDVRGYGMKITLPEDFRQSEIYISESRKDVIRGMHFQPSPYNQRKAIAVVKGNITGVILDLRPESSTFAETVKMPLTDEDNYAIIIPSQCAWGFLSNENDNIVMYSIDGEYNKNFDWGVRYDSIGYDWKIEEPIISERDRNLPSMGEMLGIIRGKDDEK